MNLRHLRVRPLRAVIAVLSVAAGVSLAVTVVVVRTSATKSFESFARSFAGPAPLRVVGPSSHGGLAESVVERVEAVPGVRAAIPMVQAITLADATDGRELSIIALGYDCRIESLIARVGCSPDLLRTVTTNSPPIVSPSLARDLGPRGVIRTNVGPKRLRGALRTDALGDVGQGRTVAYPLHVAQELFTRPGGLDAVYVLPERHADIDPCAAGWNRRSARTMRFSIAATRPRARRSSFKSSSSLASSASSHSEPVRSSSTTPSRSP